MNNFVPNFLEELAIKRNSAVSNVFLLETFDPKRIQQFVEAVKNRDLDVLFKASYKKLLLLDLQAQELIDIPSESPEMLGQEGDLLALSGSSSLHHPKQLLEALRSQPTILVIKYVYDSGHVNFLSDFLAACSHDPKLYKHKSTVVVYTSDSSLFPKTLLRLIYTIPIIPSTPEEREHLLKKVAEQISMSFQSMYNGKINIEITEDLVQASSGLTLHDVETAALESFFINQGKFTVETFTQYKVKILKTYGLQYIIPKRGFESVGGYETLKKYILNRVVKPLRNPDLAQRYGLSIPKGIILYGYPGCGKTWFSVALAKEIGLPVIKISPADLLRGIVGETESRIRQLTQLIESLAPVVVFVDEIDQLFLAREQVMMTDSGVSRRMTNMLLDWLGDEGRKSFIVGATNFIEQMDFAAIRAGRIDEIILVLPPDEKARQQILKVHTSVIRKIPLDNVDLNEIAKKTYLFTGAELEKLCLEAARLAMDEDAEKVKMEHFEEALKGFEININERQGRIRRMVQQMRRLENVNQNFLKEALHEFTSQESDTRIKSLVEGLKNRR